MPSIAEECSDHLKGLVTNVTEVSERAFEIYDNDQLIMAAEEIHTPALGILYNGLRAVEDSSKKGLMANCVFDLVLLGGERSRSAASTLDGRVETLLLLDAIRNAVIGQIAPGQRPWKFMLEGPMDVGDITAMGYVQRWSTLVPACS